MYMSQPEAVEASVVELWAHAGMDWDSTLSTCMDVVANANPSAERWTHSTKTMDCKHFKKICDLLCRLWPELPALAFTSPEPGQSHCRQLGPAWPHSWL
jgi:hypothetical protein